MMALRSNLKIGLPLGNGSFGFVFDGSDDIHPEVAVKKLDRLPTDTDAVWQLRRQTYLAEGRHLSNAQHSNVVKVHHLVEDDTSEAVYIVMEKCHGGSLQSAFKKGPMLLGDVRRFISHVTFGLGALHSRNMLHRDIKPGNILIDKKGIAKLGDFGLVTDDIILGYASHAGYSDHLAPEVINGGGTSMRSDIWALGMTMYRLLHGEAWYLTLPQPRHVVGKLGFAKNLPWLPHVPAAWRTVIRTMLNDDPKARYQNCNQVQSALAKLKTIPPWECTVMHNGYVWTHCDNKRRYFVTFTANAAGLNDFNAHSEPVGPAGNRRHFGSGENLKTHDALKQLSSLFSTKLA